MNTVYLYIKRGLDILLSCLGVIVLSPLIVIIIILVKASSRGPVLFKQSRVGKNGIHFDILKFRTMKIDTPPDTATDDLKNPDQWITNVGKILRKSSLDELPQLVNIIKGDMSIIGPRPALWNQFDLIKMRDDVDVNSIRPGLSGLAQIKGRDDLDLQTKVSYDFEYMENVSFWMDVKCFIGTITSVLQSKGVTEGGSNHE